MGKAEELIIKTATLIQESQYWDCGGNEDLAFLDLGKQILQAFHDAGGVMLAEDQTVPKHGVYISPAFGPSIEQENYIEGYKATRRTMLKAGFKRVDPLFEPNPVST